MTATPPHANPTEAVRTPLAWLRQWLGRRLARYLSREPPADPSPEARAELARVAACLRPGDVLLVEGRSRFSTGIKYLTQSTWSHAALYVGEAALDSRTEARLPDGRRACVIEADLVQGVRAVGLDTYAGLPLRICRPVSLGADEVETVIAHAMSRLGHRYDLKHIFDLLRWLLPAPPVPTRWRRRLLTLGSGDPTRAICSTLVAEAMQAVRYPILPQVTRLPRVDGREGGDPVIEVLDVRHASLFVPRDFDLSPYFEVVKPTLAGGFDHRRLAWGDDFIDAEAAAVGRPAGTPVRSSGRRRVVEAVDAVEAVATEASAGARDAAGPARGAPSAWRWLRGLWR